jgi:hypothetical protein
MKKILVIVLVMMMIMMTACGKKEEGKESGEPVPSPQKSEADDSLKIEDLNGVWAEEADNDPYYAAIVENGAIEIYEIYSGEEGCVLYWVGRCDELKDDVLKATFDEELANLSGPTDWTDEISFKVSKDSIALDGMIFDRGTELKPQASPEGMLKTMMEKHEFIHAEKYPLEITEPEFVVSKDYTRYVLFYRAQIKNPNEKFAVPFIMMKVNVTYSDGSTESVMTIPFGTMAAGDEVVYADVAWIEREDVEAVEIVFNDGTGYKYVSQDEIGIPKHDAFTITVGKKKGDLDFDGEIKNTSDVDITRGTIVTVYTKGGKLAGATTTSISDLKAGETKEFSSSLVCKPFDYDNIENYFIPLGGERSREDTV